MKRELGHTLEKVKDANSDLVYAEANQKSLEIQPEEAQGAGVTAFGEYEKNKSNKVIEQLKLEAENFAKFTRESACSAEGERNEKE